MKINSLKQCILTTDFLTSTSPNSPPSPLSNRSAPFLLSLEKEAGLLDTTTKHEKIQDTLRQGKFPLIETAQEKQVTRTDKMSETPMFPLLGVPQNHQCNSYTYTVRREPGAHPGRNNLFEPR